MPRRDAADSDRNGQTAAHCSRAAELLTTGECMNKFWLASVTVSGVVAVALHAQNTTPSLNANRVTVTGCIERASTQRPTGTTATTTPTGTAVPDTQFLLA